MSVKRRLDDQLKQVQVNFGQRKRFCFFLNGRSTTFIENIILCQRGETLQILVSGVEKNARRYTRTCVRFTPKIIH